VRITTTVWGDYQQTQPQQAPAQGGESKDGTVLLPYIDCDDVNNQNNKLFYTQPQP